MLDVGVYAGDVDAVADLEAGVAADEFVLDGVVKMLTQVPFSGAPVMRPSY